MTSIILKLDSAKTTTEITRIMLENLRYFNGSTILDHVAHKARRRINKTRFCPVCGSDYLLKHDYVWIDGKYSECGIWHTYHEVLENGEYQCENGHEFRAQYNEDTEKIEITKM